jgi:hypothetical protein
MVASRLFSFRSMSSPHQPGRRKDSPSAQLPLVYMWFLTFATFSALLFVVNRSETALFHFPDSGLEPECSPERDPRAALFKHPLDTGRYLRSGHLGRLSPGMYAANGGRLSML